VDITNDNNELNLGRIIKQRRILASLTLGELSARSGVSVSHLGRIERRERFPSAHILRRITKPLGFDEGELFNLAGYLSSWPLAEADTVAGGSSKQLDPIVASMLRQEPYEVQQAVIVILSMLKSIAKRTSDRKE